MKIARQNVLTRVVGQTKKLLKNLKSSSDPKKIAMLCVDIGHLLDQSGMWKYERNLGDVDEGDLLHDQLVKALGDLVTERELDKFVSMYRRKEGRSIGRTGTRQRLARIVARLRFAFSMNVTNTPLAKARAYAEKEFAAAGMKFGEELPEFDTNYKLLQKKCKSALDVPRIDMPVIEPEDMKKFQSNLAKGAVDVFAPYAKGRMYFPKTVSAKEGKEWIKLGFGDGDYYDDRVKGRWTTIEVRKLKPTQSQIWMENMIPKMIKFGVPGLGSSILKATVIVSKDGYILDGHHRFGQAMLVDPNLALNALFIPLDIELLLKVGKSYGESIGNKAKE